MDLDDQLYDFRRGIGDMGYPESLVIGYLNAAKRDLSKHVQIIKQFADTRSWSSVAHQAVYGMPARYAQRTGVARFDNEPLVFRLKELIEQLGDSHRHSEATTPTYFTLFRGNLELWEVPGSAADSTTLKFGIDKNETTLVLTSVDGLKSKGRALIDNEVISWEYIDTSDADNLRLTGVIRGLEGTVAAAHSNGATFTERNIEWYGALLPKRYFSRPPRSATLTASANASACTDGEHVVHITYFSQKWGSESLATEVDAVTTASQQIDIADIPVSDDGDVSHVRIWMTKAGGTDLYYVDEVTNGTTSYSITDNDATIGANSVYAKETSDVPFQYRDVEQELAISKWFWDNEQFFRAEKRLAKAMAIIQEWVESITIEFDGAYEGIEI